MDRSKEAQDLMEAHRQIIRTIFNTLENVTVMDFPEVLIAMKQEFENTWAKEDQPEDDRQK